MDVELVPDFAGPLHLWICFTHGRDAAWTLSAPGNAAPASSIVAPEVTAPVVPEVVPLPAGTWLMIGGL